ncbi:HNH endonuclease family protein [Rarobacter incanus]|uniref:Uncharacterized protein DUF1524 n=1 Tax=Rarobacter incanus TaxID=153494 RepID=A0A542SRM6_9MICO|nr:HNH endonuclease family protein [Rarobacter incanus]TQK77238.1 uncharacterized protein DUF1524 [Rarobacter incanus]
MPRKKQRQAPLIVIVALVGVGLLGAFSHNTLDANSPAPPTTADGADDTVIDVRGPAALALAQLATRGRAARTGYDRDSFKFRQFDFDRNGCDARNDVLRRDLNDVVIAQGTQGCLVLRGALPDPYSGKSIHFVYGADTSAAVQIDHVVALSDAWQKGAQAWGATKRHRFANDPLNLLAVDGPLNTAKGDDDASGWLPPNKKYRCAYVARQIAVKYSYGLWVTAAERSSMQRVLATCPGQQLPTDVTTARDSQPTYRERA